MEYSDYIEENENICECGTPCDKEYCSDKCARYYITE